MTDIIKPVLLSGLTFGTALSIVQSVVGKTSIADIVAVASSYGDIPFIVNIENGVRDWNIVTDIVSSVKSMFYTSQAYAKRKSIFDMIEAASSFIVSENKIIVDGRSFRVRSHVIYSAYWTLCHPIDTDVGHGTPEEVFMALNSKSIAVDAFWDAINTIAQTSSEI